MSFPRYPTYKPSGVEWLGEVPEHWETLRLRFAVTLNPSKQEAKELGEQEVVSFLPMEAIGEDGSLRLENEREVAECLSGYTYFRDGDVCVAKITPCFENGKGAILRELKGGIGFGTTELIVARPQKERITSEFLDYLFRSQTFRRLGESEMYGAGGQKRVPDSFVRDFTAALPSIEEQNQATTFLDRETAKIDALIAEQQRLIELLQEKRQAVISHAVTKGLNPDAPMKDSGVEWLGEVPEHWEVVPLKNLIQRGTSISYGIVQPGEPLEHGIPFVQTTNMSKGDFSLEVLQRTSPEIALGFPRSTLTGGEVLLGIRASIGAAHVAPAWLEGANLSRGVARIMPSAAIMSHYLVFYLRSEATANYWLLAKQGSTFNEVSIETVKNLRACLPSIAEQVTIVSHVDQLNSQFNNALGQSTQLINLLQERRSALIPDLRRRHRPDRCAWPGARGRGCISSIAKMIQIVLSSGELRPDRQALCSRFLQKLHRVSGEELINSHQYELMLHRLRDQQAIKRITVNGWKLSQMSHCPLVNWQRRDSMGCSLLRKIGCR
jgi:type I restriction enzyme S subunit